MATTLVQRGVGPRPDLFIWFMGDIDAELRAGAPRDTIVKFFNGAGTSKYEAPPTIEDVIRLFPADYKTVTVAGWSAGGRGVQRVLDAALYRGGRVPDAVLVADGLYAPLADGLPDMSTLRSVVDYASRAALGQGICVLWHSAIKTPYASSSQCVAGVVRAVAETCGPMATWTPPRLDGRLYSRAQAQGGFHALSYAGNGAPEHLAEVHMVDEVMRAMLPWASDDNAAAAPTVRTGAKVPTGGSLHRAILAAAERDLNVGVREDLGHNDGTVLRERYFPRFGLKPGANWCAAAGCDWMAQGEAETGRKSLVAGSPGAKAMMAQFIAAGAWVSAAAVRADHSLLEPGMAAVLDRSVPGRPETAWWGHFGIDVSIGEEVYWAIEGNSGERGEQVAIVERRLDDPRLLGFGRFER